MTERTVNVRLDLSTTGFRRGAQQAEQDSRRIAATATSAAEQTERSFNSAFTGTAAAATEAMRVQQGAFERGAQTAVAAGRTVAEAGQAAAASTERIAAAAADIPATFRAAGASAASSLTEISSSALGASQALSRTGATTVSMSSAASEALARLAGAAGGSLGEVTAASGEAAASTRFVATAATDIPPAFRAAATAAAASMTEIAAASTRSSFAIGQTTTALTSSSLAAATGVERLSLASRLALSETAAAAGVVTAEVAAAQSTIWGRAGMAVTGWAAATRAGVGSTASAMVTASERGEKAFGALRTAGLVMIGVFAAASLTAAKFEKSMSGVAAVADATAEQMGQLRTAALEAGRDTAYSASQAANAEGELAKAGVSVDDILGGALRGSLALAAAGQLDLAEAATISAQSMNTFGLKGKDVGHIADVLASGANKSAADVHGLGESLRMGGLLAHQTGLSLEDTVGTLSAFADHALIGSDAGTSLKTMLQRLVPQSDEALRMMQKLGFSAYDTSGNFVGLTQLAGNLKSSFSNLTPEARNAAFATIFGSDAVRSATILYELGADGIDKYRTAVDDSGAASRMAATQMDNLAGDLEALKGSLEVALINGGTAANDVLRDMVKWVTDLVNAYSGLPPWLQTTTGAVLAVGGAITILTGSLMLALPRLVAFKASITALAETMPRMAAAASTTMTMLGGIGLIAAVAGAALAIYSSHNQNAKQTVEALTEAVKSDSNAIGENTRKWVVHKLETDGALAAARSLGISTTDLTDAVLGNADAMARVTAAYEPLKEKALAAAKSMDANKVAGEGWLQNTQKVGAAINQLSGDVQKGAEAAHREAEAAGSAAGNTTKLGDAAKVTAGDIADTRTEVEKLNDSLNSLNGANISATKAAIGMQSSLADLKKEIKDNGRNLDITTAKGREVKGAFLDAASAAQAHAEAVMKQTGSTEQAMIVLGQDVDALKKVMEQAGFTKDQIDSLTSAYAQVPAAKTTQITDPGALQTIKDLQDVKAKIEDVPPGKTITVKAPSSAAIQDLAAIGFTVEAIPGSKDVKVTVPANDAVNGSTRIQQLINGIQGKAVTVDVNYRFPAGLHRAGDLLSEQAEGSVTRYAAGGIRAAADGLSTRQAGISDRAILWAEAGREAYIPLDPSRRRRSMMLLGEVASIFGQQLIPVGPTARDLIPARSLSTPTAPATGVGGGRGDTTIHLHGARQSSEEQLADLARNLQFVT
ncbi:phage tail tape measure protein [Kitasatospora sp. NPDC052868]|uniref:phage tail tape measure protein n=1 Tax=Kitasatospora sp. NPDC052868 TaxID=3364060 RepID=UPI0037C97164